MSRKNTKALKDIQSLCRMQHLDEKELCARAKMVLSTYRGVCWSTIGRAKEIQDQMVCYCGTELDGALVYLETFAPDEIREQFEERIVSLYETRWMIELVENAMLHVRDYPEQGELYFEILSKCYLTHFKYEEAELTELLNMERSRFYDRKKEAVLVFGLSLWGKSIPQLQDFLQEGKREAG